MTKVIHCPTGGGEFGEQPSTLRHGGKNGKGMDDCLSDHRWRRSLKAVTDLRLNRKQNKELGLQTNALGKRTVGEPLGEPFKASATQRSAISSSALPLDKDARRGDSRSSRRMPQPKQHEGGETPVSHRHIVERVFVRSPNSDRDN